jgi:hypothetical protein
MKTAMAFRAHNDSKFLSQVRKWLLEEDIAP